jgi:hypothetical protein
VVPDSENLLPSPSLTRDFKYSAAFTPLNPFFDPSRRDSFLVGLNYEVIFRGTLIQRQAGTGAVLPPAEPRVASAVMINHADSGAPRWDGSDRAAYTSSIGSLALADPATFSAGPLRFTYEHKLEHSIGHRSSGARWAEDVRRIASPAGLPKTDLLLRVEAPLAHEFVAYPAVSAASITYRSAELFFTTRRRSESIANCNALFGCRADRVFIQVGAQADDGRLLSISDAANAMGFDSLNFVNKIVRTNAPLLPKTPLPQGQTLSASPASPVIDPYYGGWQGMPQDGDLNDPYYNLVVGDDGRARVRADMAAAAFGQFSEDQTHVTGSVFRAEDATALVFQDKPYYIAPGTCLPDLITGITFSCIPSGKTDFVTTLVGVKAEPCAADSKIPNDCFSYTPIGNRVFTWSSYDGVVLGPLEIGTDFALQNLEPLTETQSAEVYDLGALTFEQFEAKFGVSIDEFVALPTSVTAVPEAATVYLMLAGLLLTGGLTRRRWQTRVAATSASLTNRRDLCPGSR